MYNPLFNNNRRGSKHFLNFKVAYINMDKYSISQAAKKVSANFL